MRSDRNTAVSGRSLRTGLLVVRFFGSVCVFCMLAGCGTESRLLSELRQEALAEDHTEAAGGEGSGASSGEDAAPVDRNQAGEDSGSDEGVLPDGACKNDGALAETGRTPQSGEAGNGAGDVENMIVHVCGAVTNPGVYELPQGSRFYEAVEAAGGFAEGACRDHLNMAAPLADGSRLEIPLTEEILAREAAESTAGAPDGGERGEEYSYYTPPEMPEQGAGDGGTSGDGTVNINTADIAGLCELPGIGEGRAKAIIEYRERQGGFQKKEDIMQVSGIGEKMYARMEEYLRVE